MISLKLFVKDFLFSVEFLKIFQNFSEKWQRSFQKLNKALFRILGSLLLKFETSQTAQKPPKLAKNKPNQPKTSQTTQKSKQTSQTTQKREKTNSGTNGKKNICFLIILKNGEPATKECHYRYSVVFIVLLFSVIKPVHIMLVWFRITELRWNVSRQAEEHASSPSHSLNKEPVKIDKEPPEKNSGTCKKLICNNLTSACCLL